MDIWFLFRTIFTPSKILIDTETVSFSEFSEVRNRKYDLIGYPKASRMSLTAFLSKIKDLIKDLPHAPAPREDYVCMKPIPLVPVAMEPQMGLTVPLATSVRVPIISPGINRNGHDYTSAWVRDAEETFRRQYGAIERMAAINRELDYAARRLAAGLQVPADHIVVDRALCNPKKLNRYELIRE